jgi:hypothetical protein
MDKQQIFNTVYLGLAKQGKRAFSNSDSAPAGGSCQYRTIDGLKCAAGMLMTDEEFAGLKAKPHYERQYSPNNLKIIHMDQSTVPAVIRDNLDFVQELQAAHDEERSEFTDTLALLRTVAAHHNLTIPEIPA